MNVYNYVIPERFLLQRITQHGLRNASCLAVVLVVSQLFLRDPLPLL